jgi:hypothetical protein
MSYITFKTIGGAGDLGSQIQQYASLYAVAKASGKTIVFPESSLKLDYGFKFANLLDIPIETKPDDFFKDFIDIRPDDQQIVDSSVFQLQPNKNYNIVNRFDLYKYWHPTYAEDVLQWSWNKDHEQAAKRMMESIAQPGKELVAIHVRRGDYLLPQHDHFCKLNTDYYGEAIKPYIDELEKYHFVIFSNDIEWCKESLIEGDMVTFVEPGLDYVDMIAMSMCNHFIVANSSYSWWAAFRSKNPNKKVTCPINYLKSYSPWSHINGNYYPSEWNGIHNNSI